MYIYLYNLIELKILLWKLFDSVSDKYSSGSNENKCGRGKQLNW